MNKPIQRMLAVLTAALSLASAFAHHESTENKVLTRDGAALGDFIDVDARSKRLFAKSGEPISPLVTDFTLTPGYSSNASLTPNGDGAAFLGAALGLGYTRQLTKDSVLTAGYEVGALLFGAGEDDNNEVDQSAVVAWQGAIASGVQYRLSVSDTQIDLDYRNVLNVAAAGLELRTNLTENLIGGVSYMFQTREVQLPVIDPRRDADAYRHIPAIFVGSDLSRYRAGLPKVTIAYSYSYNLADGADEDYAAYRLAFRATGIQVGAGLTADFEYAFEDRSGENLNGRFLGLARRGDELTKAQLTVNHDLLSLAASRISLLIGYERSESNVLAANYHGWTYGATATFRF